MPAKRGNTYGERTKINMVPTDDRHAAPQRSISEQKLAANHANAQKSTGPRTAEGKRRVARNAVKHGILAREVFIGEGDGAEREEDFLELQAGLYAAYQPRDVAEQIEVDNIVASTWLLRRAYRATTGDTRSGLDSVRRDWERHRREHFDMLLPIAALDNGATLRTSSLGCAHLLRVLDAVRATLTTGSISKSSLDLLLTYFPAASSAIASARLESAGAATHLSLAEEMRRQLTTIVMTEREELERGRAEAECREQAELSAEAARLALPGGTAAVRDLRYITALRRDTARSHRVLAMLRARPTVESSDVDSADGNDNGDANESGDLA